MKLLFKPLLKISRPVYAGSSLIHFGIGFLLAKALCPSGEVEIVRAILVYLIMVLLVFFGYGLNSIYDIDTDRLNIATLKDKVFQKNPLLSGNLPEEVAKRYVLVLAVLGIMGAFFVSIEFLVLTFIFISLSFIYSVKPRCKGIKGFDMLLLILGDSTILFLGYYGSGICLELEVGIPLILVCFMLFTFAMTLPTVVADIEADRQAGLYTTAVTLGEKKSHIVTLFTGVIGICFSIYAMYVFEEVGVFLILLIFVVAQVGLLFEYAVNYLRYEKSLMLKNMNYTHIGILGHVTGLSCILVSMLL